MKILQIGVGRWGKNHARVWKALGAELFISDLLPEEKIAAEHGVPRDHVARDYRSLFGRVDAVDVVTPADTHFEIASAALEAGKDVFVEKPPCLTVDELDKMAAKARGRILQFGFIFRFHPVANRLEAWAREGRLGELRYLHGRFCGFKRPRADVGAIFTDGIHFVDLALRLFGRAPGRISAAQRDFLGIGMDDTTHAAIEFGQGLAYLEAGFHYPTPVQELTLVGDRAAARGLFREGRVEFFDQRHSRDGQRWIANAAEPKIESVDGEEPLTAELREFVESVKTRKAPRVAIADVRAALETTLRIYEAAKR